MQFFRTFRWSFGVSLLGLIFAFWIGWHPQQSVTAGLNALFLVSILAALEISLSFDNAVVNARVVQQMSPIWQRRFLTWGLAIAVFGVRFLLPVLIVSAVGQINPWESVLLAVNRPQEYSQMMLSAHLSVTGFGATFLLAVAFKYFFDETKDVHWIQWLERPLVKLGKLQAFELGLTMLIMLLISTQLESYEEKAHFLEAAGGGLVAFLAIDGISAYFSEKHTAGAGLSLFLYLEMLDASFSVDGVIGAFAITYDLLVIVTGLLIGAMYVRSLTVYMVAKNTLGNFIYLEHGAFYALAALAGLMLLNILHPVPEWMTGLVGVVFLGLSIFSSMRHRKQNLTV